MTTPAQVLSEFIDAWSTGQRPNVREYLARVPEGPGRDDLADQIGVWLETAPAPSLGDAARAAIRTEPTVRHVVEAVGSDAGLWPELVPRLRARAGLSVPELAARVVERFRLGA